MSAPLDPTRPFNPSEHTPNVLKLITQQSANYVKPGLDAFVALLSSPGVLHANLVRAREEVKAMLLALRSAQGATYADDDAAAADVLAHLARTTNSAAQIHA